MATLSGRVVYDANRSVTINAGDSGISNVTVVLRNTTTGLRLSVITDTNGNYVINNVPDGTYTLVESYQTFPAVATPGDFSTAIIQPAVIGEDPPISYITAPNPAITSIDSLTPNTINLTVSGVDITNLNFLDGPYIDIPITSSIDPCSVIGPTNLITAANNGTFGSNPPGTPANTIPPLPPYSSITDFPYSTVPPLSYGQYTVTNMWQTFFGFWWAMTDHTVGDETGRAMFLNGGDPGAVIFTETLTVQQNTNYIFTGWVANILTSPGSGLPQPAVAVYDEFGNLLIKQILIFPLEVNPIAPQWVQIGTVINSGNNTKVTVQFTTESSTFFGNDFALDDVEFKEISVVEFTPVKTISKSYASIGDTVTYTVTLKNTCKHTLTNVSFQDSLPPGIDFVPTTVFVNGTNQASFNPNVGFPVPDIVGGASAVIKFDAKVNAVPSPNPINNIATMKYNYAPVLGGIALNYTKDSNPAPLAVILPGDIIKTVDKIEVIGGEKVTYTVTVKNTGIVDKENYNLIDYAPTGTTVDPTSIQVFSATGPVVNSSTTSVVDVQIGTVKPGQNVIITFDVYTTENTPTPVINTALGYFCYEPVKGQKLCVNEAATAAVTIVQVGNITGTIWYDSNCNGIRETGEKLAEGITVELYKSPDLTTPIKFTTTDVNGNYSFGKLSQGDYYVKVTLPTGYSYTLSNVGSDTTDSDIDNVTGFSNKITISLVSFNRIVDSGLCHPNKITGIAFFDCNKDGIYDGNEPTLCGVKVSLQDNQTNQIVTVTTNCDGSYEFTNLRAGSYTVTVEKPVDIDYTIQNSAIYSGSKPSVTTGSFNVVLTNTDYLEGFAGFTGPLKLRLKYCTNLSGSSSNCSFDSCSLKGETPCEDKTNCLGCNSCRNNKPNSVTKTNCNNCKCTK